MLSREGDGAVETFSLDARVKIFGAGPVVERFVEKQAREMQENSVALHAPGAGGLTLAHLFTRCSRESLDRGARQHASCERHTFGHSPGTGPNPTGWGAWTQDRGPAAGGWPDVLPVIPHGACAGPAEANTREVGAVAITEEDFAEDLAVIHDPETYEAFHVEQHGIDFIPESERWATPRDIFGMWAGASVQVEYFIYGAILMTFGLTFAQVLFVIVLGNLSYFLLGLCSLQGPNTGTSVFAINRAPFGPNGSRPISFFNWVTQIGFEVEGLILIVGAGLVLMSKAGFLPGSPAKVVLVIAAVLIQGILPFLGHAAIVKTLRWLIVPFVILFAIMLGFAIPHANLHVVKTSGDWQAYMEALAFTIALSGLGWAECGNDYTRYCPTDTSKKGIVGWVFLGTAVPEILIMTLGAVVGHLRPEHRDGRRRRSSPSPTRAPSRRGSWWSSSSSPWCSSSPSTASTCTRPA